MDPLGQGWLDFFQFEEIKLMYGTLSIHGYIWKVHTYGRYPYVHMYGRLWSHVKILETPSNWTLEHTSRFYFNKTAMDVEAVKTQELPSSFSKFQGAVIVQPCPVCEPRGMRFEIICHAFACHCSWQCRSNQLCYSCLGHELRTPIWLNRNKSAERIQPLRSFTSESSTVPCPCKESWGLSEVPGSSARLWTLPSPSPLSVEDLRHCPQGPQELSCTVQHLLSILVICDWFGILLSK